MATKHGQEAIEANKIRHAKYKATINTIGIIAALAIAFVIVNEYIL